MFTERKLFVLMNELRAAGIHDEAVLQAMQRVPRQQFVPGELSSRAYENVALPIGQGQTISQPYIVALMTEALQLTGQENVLEVGTGSGYQTAVLSLLARSVTSVERLSKLSVAAQELLAGYQNLRCHVGDGTRGWPEGAPYEAIMVTAAAPEIPPALFAQLSASGRMVIPVGKDEIQVLYLIVREEDQFRKTELCRCRFVKLIGEEGWFSPHFSS